MKTIQLLLVTLFLVAFDKPKELYLSAILTESKYEQILTIQLVNNTNETKIVPELSTATLIIENKNSHIAFASNPARKDKVIMLNPGEKLEKIYKFKLNEFKNKELSLSHYSRFGDVKYKAIKVKIRRKKINAQN